MNGRSTRRSEHSLFLTWVLLPWLDSLCRTLHSSILYYVKFCACIYSSMKISFNYNKYHFQVLKRKARTQFNRKTGLASTGQADPTCAPASLPRNVQHIHHLPVRMWLPLFFPEQVSSGPSNRLIVSCYVYWFF